MHYTEDDAPLYQTCSPDEPAVNSYAAPVRGIPMPYERTDEGFVLLRTGEVERRLAEEEGE